jgi:hypothetical protein
MSAPRSDLLTVGGGTLHIACEDDAAIVSSPSGPVAAASAACGFASRKRSQAALSLKQFVPDFVGKLAHAAESEGAVTLHELAEINPGTPSPCFEAM